MTRKEEALHVRVQGGRKKGEFAGPRGLALTLGKLEAFARSGLACLFTLTSSWITAQVTGFFEGYPQFLIVFEKSSGNTQGAGARLTIYTPAMDFCHHVKLAVQVERLKGAFNGSSRLIETEVSIQLLLVYRDVTLSFP